MVYGIDDLPKNTTPLRFWCHVCDARTVDSHDETTGKFFAVHGHVLTYNHHLGKLEVTDTAECDYPLVTWAVCARCL